MKNKFIMFSGYGLFWSWNLILTLLTIFLLFPEMIIPIVTGTIVGSVFLDQGLFSLLIFLVPLFTIILGLTKRFRSNPSLLLKLFYGIELPLFFLIIARLTLFRELHPGTIHILLLSLLAIIAYAFTLFNSTLFNKTERQFSAAMSISRQVGITCSLILAMYIALFLLFFLFPVGKEFLLELFGFKWLGAIFKHPLVLLAAVFLFYTFTLLLGLPLMLITLYGKAFFSNSQKSVKRLGIKPVILLVFITIAANGLIFHLANQQQQVEAFALFEQAINSEYRKKRLLEKHSKIRHGLVNAYLASYRYLSSAKNSNIIEIMYAESFAMDRNGLPKMLQTGFNFLASPFLYQGNRWHADAQKAERLYQQFFDIPIEKAESKAINQALKSNWYRDGMQAGLINKDRQKVLITHQSLSIKEKAHSATITLNETYQNQTFEQQEIYYYFSLPEEAVLTGIWLSDDPKVLKKYTYSVAPRGAAQKLYKQERDRRVDPALLEQVGPKQYRLRVFPIPEKIKQRKQLRVKTESLFMQLAYDIPLKNDRQWLLPKLLEKRNVYWDNSTRLMVNGKIHQRPEEKSKDLWLPISIPAQSATPILNTIRKMALNDKQILQVNIQPRKKWNQRNIISKQLINSEQNIAVLIDTSFSMARIKHSLQSTLEQLEAVQEKTQIKIDFFAIDDQVKQINRIQEWIENDQVLFGHNTTVSQIRQWQQFVNHRKQYNAAILLTDQGNYEVKDKQNIMINKNTPLWILHLGNEPAYAYADTLLDYIYQSGGGIGHDLNDVLARIIWKHQRNSKQLSQISQNYIWHYKILDKTDTFSSKQPALSAIIAHQWISADFNRHSDYQNASQIKLLDGLHLLAKNNSLVSPFSSMIVLVNKRQQEVLKKLSKDDDRFKRDIDSGKKSIVQGNDLFSVSSVPEPEEWALIIVVIVILSAVVLNKRQEKMRAQIEFC